MTISRVDKIIFFSSPREDLCDTTIDGDDFAP